MQVGSVGSHFSVTSGGSLSKLPFSASEAPTALPLPGAEHRTGF
jgi:hypothetical protein